jgi:hypothetical protein
MAKPEPDYYDEPMTDQDPRPDSVAPNKSEDQSDSDETGYQSFLAPKTAFPEDVREVGSVHRVKTVRVLPDELELQCLGKGGDESEATDNAQEEQDEMYQ